MTEPADSTEPWARRDRESASAFAAFEAYRDLGAGRSIDAVAARLAGRQKGAKRAPGRLRKWSVDHRWVERAAAYDDHLATIRRRRVEEATRRQADEWVRRRKELPELEFRMALKLVEKADAVIDRRPTPPGRPLPGNPRTDNLRTDRPRPRRTRSIRWTSGGPRRSCARRPLWPGPPSRRPSGRKNQGGTRADRRRIRPGRSRRTCSTGPPARWSNGGPSSGRRCSAGRPRRRGPTGQRHRQGDLIRAWL